LSGFEGKPFVTPDGLEEGYLVWRASNGDLYETEYPSGKVRERIEQFIGAKDTEEYYVWRIELKDGIVCYIDARNGVICLTLPTHPFVPTHPTKLLPAYTLDISFPHEEGYVSIRKGESVTLPVAIKSLVDEPIRIRLVLLSCPSREEPLPKFITYETEGYITINPHEAVQTQITIKTSEDATLGEYSFELTGELEKPVEGWGGEGYVFGIVILS